MALKFIARVGVRKNSHLNLLLFGVVTLLIGTFFWSTSQSAASYSRLIYVWLLMMMCSAPYFYMDSRKGHHLFLVVFLPFYFLIFAIGDLVYVLGGGEHSYQESPEVQQIVDVMILAGLIAYCAGYGLVLAVSKKNQRGWFVEDWDYGKVRFASMVCWCIGTLAFVTIFFFKDQASAAGLPLSIISNLKRLAQVGSLMMIYLVLVKNDRLMKYALLAVVVFEIMLGFAANTKEVSFMTPLLYLILYFVLRGTVSWILVGLLVGFMVFYVKFFSIYRYEVIQERAQTPLEALSKIDKSIETIMDRAETNRGTSHKDSAGFLKERVGGRKYVAIIVDGLNKGQPMLNGESLNLFFASFVPRIMWKDKPEISVGKKFNHQFKISASSLTYIPTTQLGEFYWNFKGSGVVLGMLFIGMVMAYLCVHLNLSTRINLPRILCCLVLIYLLCARFEESFALQYSNAVRQLVIVWVLHALLKKPNHSKGLAK